MTLALGFGLLVVGWIVFTFNRLTRLRQPFLEQYLAPVDRRGNDDVVVAAQRSSSGSGFGGGGSSGGGGGGGGAGAF
jgi:uncharacterized membrane protein YgcG